ncbi:hypothetical protein [Solibacillus sp. FSL K6-1523]|uniref:hypothetical protein n=1 Tax=Solibacillus sp. FSL K6-1523 TaxID=2921471 RepID=UPI0030FAC65D
MKKLMSFLIMTVFILTACNSELAITEQDTVPKSVNEILGVLDSDDYVQMINDSKKDISYIVINTEGKVTVRVESKGDSILIYIDEVETENEDKKQRVFKLTRDRDYEMIELFKNDESIPFDTVAAI